jgi:hypothetical protein
MMYRHNFVAVVKCNGQILRERSGGSVYLPFGAEYSIMLKNKDARRVSVNIEVDGENVLNGHNLIMNGNETQEIKGFMRNMSKTNRFKFIKKTKEIQKYRGDRLDDGLVRVTYQFERGYPTNVTWNDNIFPTNLKGPDSWDGPWTRCFYNDSNLNFRGNNISNATYSCSTSQSVTPNADEGITVKGEKISQAFCYGDIGELEPQVHTIVLHLKGQTKKKKPLKRPLTVKTKIRCSTCGRKNRSTNKFCYNCGTYLD